MARERLLAALLVAVLADSGCAPPLVSSWAPCPDAGPDAELCKQSVQPEPDIPAGQPLPFCLDYAEVLCAAAAACGLLEECGDGSGIGCRLVWQSACQEIAGDLVDAGLMAYDEQKGQQCLDATQVALQDCTCLEETIQVLKVCADAFAGAVGEGGSCASTWHCLPGLECEGHKCEAKPIAGEPCGSSYGTCLYGNYCGQDDKCHADKGEGEDCQGEASSGNPCKSGLFCSPGTGTCQAPYVVGESCADAPTKCAVGLWCSPDTLTCLHRLGKGEQCPLQEEHACEVGLYCSLASQTCEATLKPGEVCDEDEQCASHHCSQGHCDPYDELGECVLVVLL